MKKEHFLAIMFFGGLWGISEAVFGNFLYRVGDVRFVSIPLTVIGLMILSVARVYFPQKGIPTLIAACAMFYKFLNEPFFACHLFGILLLGVAYDLIFNFAAVKNRALAAVATVFVGHALFALLVTYVVRYDPWVQAGFSKVAWHIFGAGSITAVACAVFVPLAYRLGQRLQNAESKPFAWQWRPVTGTTSLLALAFWAFGVAAFLR